MASFIIDLDANTGPTVETEQLGILTPNGRTHWADSAGKLLLNLPGDRQSQHVNLNDFDAILRQWRGGLQVTGLPTDDKNLNPVLIKRAVVVALGVVVEV